jgi:O-antigen ligase
MKFFNSKIVIILLLFPFFMPAYFSTIPTVDSVYNIFRMLSAFVAVCIFIYYKFKISKYLFMLIVYRVVTLIPTLVNNGDYITWFNRTAMILVVCIIIERAIAINARKTLAALTILLTSLITINLLTWSPDGLYHDLETGKEYFFLGLRTRFADSIFPALAISLIYSYYKKKRITFSVIFLFIVSYLTFVLEWVATAFLSINILVFFLVTYKSKIPQVLNAKVLAIVALIMNLSIIFLRIQDVFSFIIVGILNKDLTFTGRTYIWDSAMEVIKQSWVWGYGETTNGTFAFYGWQLWQGHSQIIQLLHDGGLLAVIIFFVMNYFVIKELMRFKSSRYSAIIGFTLFVIYFMMIMEIPGYYTYYYVLLTIGANLEKIIKQDQN